MVTRRSEDSPEGWRGLVEEYWLLALLVFAPIAFVLEHVFHAGGTTVFLTSSLAIIPLAALMGRATETLAERLGEGPGGLLNATFGNAAELIIAVMALDAGLHELVKASITGSIIGNILLVFGIAALWGGLGHRRQTFNRTAASLGATMLVLSSIALIVPAIFHRIASVEGAVEQELSLEISIVLMLTYVLSLVFTLKTHRHLYVGTKAGAEHGRGPDAEHGRAADGGEPVASRAAGRGGEGAHSSTWRAVLLLLGATAAIALMSELLIGAVEEAAVAWGMNEVFVGVILVALIGNAAEHSSAIIMAGLNRMDAAVTIAVGSSIQVALFVAPLLVFLSYVVGPGPMDLLFTPLEVVAVGIAVGIIAFIAHDGETHWMEGVQLLAVYVILALAFFFLPV